MSNSSLALAYASLLLSDAGVACSAANIQTVLKAAKLSATGHAVSSLESALKETNVATHVENSLGGLGGAPAAASTSAAPAAATKKEAPKVEEAPKEEEADMDMGDLFG